MKEEKESKHRGKLKKIYLLKHPTKQNSEIVKSKRKES